MPSLKDLAKECGVSVATVSKALNDQPDISPATRERVRAAAHRMGYLPNAAARSLKTNRTYNLGVLFVDERQSGLTHEYFSAVLDSFKVEAEKHGYDITFINHNISGKSMSYLEHCRYRNVDGVVIACVNFYDPQVVDRLYPRRKDRRYREPRCRFLSGLRRAWPEDPGSLCAGGHLP